MLDPQEWALPEPETILAAIYRGGGVGRRDTWVFSQLISSVDLYSYLKHRFGEPNGFAMALRSPSVDNLIHWNCTVTSGPTILDVRGLDMANEITAFLAPDAEAPVWSAVEDRLVEEFQRERTGMQALRRQFEQWHLFTNTHQVLRAKLERQVARLRELDLKNLRVPAEPRTAEELPGFSAELAMASAVCADAMALCLDTQFAAPVFAESAVDLLTHLLAKPEVRGDRRLFDNQRRRGIDVRVKSLHLHCDGFATRIEGNEEAFKEFMRLMNRRNDRLHGNVNPTTRTGSPIYFDHRFIPLFASPQSLPQLALAHALASVDPDAAIRDWEVAQAFVALLLSNLESDVRETVEAAFGQQQLGYRPETGSIGVILPQARVGLFPRRGPVDTDGAANS